MYHCTTSKIITLNKSKGIFLFAGSFWKQNGYEINDNDVIISTCGRTSEKAALSKPDGQQAR